LKEIHSALDECGMMKQNFMLVGNLLTFHWSVPFPSKMREKNNTWWGRGKECLA
jgi:hypothetical protein